MWLNVCFKPGNHISSFLTAETTHPHKPLTPAPGVVLTEQNCDHMPFVAAGSWLYINFDLINKWGDVVIQQKKLLKLLYQTNNDMFVTICIIADEEAVLGINYI